MKNPVYNKRCLLKLFQKNNLVHEIIKICPRKNVVLNNKFIKEMCETQNEREIGAASAIYFDYEHEANLKRLLSLSLSLSLSLLYRSELHGMWESDMNLSFHKARYYKSIHRDLIPIAWHPDRYLDWCIDEDEKRDFYFDR